MALTRRFGLTKFGGRLGGSLSDDGSKFSSVDRDTIDRLLAALEVHHHEGGIVLGDPTAAPTALVSPTGGTLPAGTTFYYKYALVDASGLETAASPEVAVVTPSPVVPPSAPSVYADFVTGASLAAGLYYYAISCVVDGQETPVTTPTLITIAVDRNVARLTLPALPAGAGQFRVWRQRADESGFSPIGFSGPGEFVDNGSVAANACPTDPLAGPNNVNRTNSRNVITVSLPAGITDVRWRLYRSTMSGNYPSPSMVADVVQTTGENSGPIVSTYVDLGGPTLGGAPQIQSQVLLPSAPVAATSVSIAVPNAQTATGTDVQAAMAQLDAALNSGGSGYGSQVLPMNLVLTDSTNAFWQVAATEAGAILMSTYTGTSVARAAGAGPVLSDSAGIHWRIDVTTAGVLTASTTTAVEFASGRGPLITSPTRTWRLGIDVDGHPTLTFVSHDDILDGGAGPVLSGIDGKTWVAGVSANGSLTLQAIDTVHWAPAPASSAFVEDWDHAFAPPATGQSLVLAPSEPEFVGNDIYYVHDGQGWVLFTSTGLYAVTFMVEVYDMTPGDTAALKVENSLVTMNGQATCPPGETFVDLQISFVMAVPSLGTSSNTDCRAELAVYFTGATAPTVDGYGFRIHKLDGPKRPGPATTLPAVSALTATRSGNNLNLGWVNPTGIMNQDMLRIWIAPQPRNVAAGALGAFQVDRVLSGTTSTVLDLSAMTGVNAVAGQTYDIGVQRRRSLDGELSVPVTTTIVW